MTTPGDLTINRGRTTRFGFKFKALDLTGSVLHLHVKRYVTDPEPLVALSTAAGTLVLTPGADSLVVVTFPAALTAPLEPGQYVFDMARVVDGQPADLFPQHTLTVNLAPTNP